MAAGATGTVGGMSIAAEARSHLDALPSAAGRRAVVTGGNSGLGLETARFLAYKGAAVVIAARDLSKGEQARASVLADVPGADVEVVRLDLASLASVAECAARLAEAPLDVVVCNAGIMALDRATTADGFEAQLGVNHLGHFALVGHLFRRLVATPGARVVAVTSSAAYLGRIDFDDLMAERGYDRWRAYNQSKLANVLFVRALARRFAAAGGGATAHAAHPGLVFTQLQRRLLATAEDLHWRDRLFLGRIIPTLGQGVQMGALPQVYAALSERAGNGDLWAPRWFARGRPVRAWNPRAALDVAVQERLWAASEELTGVGYAPAAEGEVAR